MPTRKRRSRRRSPPARRMTARARRFRSDRRLTAKPNRAGELDCGWHPFHLVGCAKWSARSTVTRSHLAPSGKLACRCPDCQLTTEATQRVFSSVNVSAMPMQAPQSGHGLLCLGSVRSGRRARRLVAGADREHHSRGRGVVRPACGSLREDRIGR